MQFNTFYMTMNSVLFAYWIYYYFCRNWAIRNRLFQRVFHFAKYGIMTSLFQVMELYYSSVFNNPYGLSLEDQEEEEEKIEQKEEIKYENKYQDKYLLLQERELSTEELDHLKNSILFEHTPIGNVIMFYDNKRETFVYFSDNAMPYRYLEVIAKKYVIMNNCKSIYVNMEEEIEQAKKVWEENVKKQREKEEEEKKTISDKPKNVFAQLKKYNNVSLNSASIPVRNSNVGGGATTIKPSFNSMQQPMQQNQRNQQPEDSILKGRSNRYSCEGKMANFSFLKKVEKKELDKRLNMSFAEFKKMQTHMEPEP